MTRAVQINLSGVQDRLPGAKCKPSGNIAATVSSNSATTLRQYCGINGFRMQIIIAAILAILPQYVSAKPETVYTLMHIDLYALVESGYFYNAYFTAQDLVS